VPKIGIKTASRKHYALLFDLSTASSILLWIWSVTCGEPSIKFHRSWQQKDIIHHPGAMTESP
jgi:hypothetical protein